jgi:hypothetical protein
VNLSERKEKEDKKEGKAPFLFSSPLKKPFFVSPFDPFLCCPWFPLALDDARRQEGAELEEQQEVFFSL